MPQQPEAPPVSRRRPRFGPVGLLRKQRRNQGGHHRAEPGAVLGQQLVLLGKEPGEEAGEQRPHSLAGGHRRAAGSAGVLPGVGDEPFRYRDRHPSAESVLHGETDIRGPGAVAAMDPARTLPALPIGPTGGHAAVHHAGMLIPARCAKAGEFLSPPHGRRLEDRLLHMDLAQRDTPPTSTHGFHRLIAPLLDALPGVLPEPLRRPLRTLFISAVARRIDHHRVSRNTRTDWFARSAVCFPLHRIAGNGTTDYAVDRLHSPPRPLPI
ncbi:hypothetical protein GCM10027570_52500 [Streptomonospora sediminis]